MSDSSIQESITPHDNDVLMGRGGKNNQHVGNEKLRGLARQECENYRQSSKKGKSDISRALVVKVHEMDPPGRFLRRNQITQEWEEVGDGIAREKTSQVLRDAVSIASQMTGATSPTVAQATPDRRSLRSRDTEISELSQQQEQDNNPSPSSSPLEPLTTAATTTSETFRPITWEFSSEYERNNDETTATGTCTPPPQTYLSDQNLRYPPITPITASPSRKRRRYFSSSGEFASTPRNDRPYLYHFPSPSTQPLSASASSGTTTDAHDHPYSSQHHECYQSTSLPERDADARYDNPYPLHHHYRGFQPPQRYFCTATTYDNPYPPNSALQSSPIQHGRGVTTAYENPYAQQYRDTSGFHDHPYSSQPDHDFQSPTAYEHPYPLQHNRDIRSSTIQQRRNTSTVYDRRRSDSHSIQQVDTTPTSYDNSYHMRRHTDCYVPPTHQGRDSSTNYDHSAQQYHTDFQPPTHRRLERRRGR